MALGSYWGLVPFAGIVPFLLWRLFDEERFLVQNLPGYGEYQKNVRYRLIPRILVGHLKRIARRATGTP